MVSIPHVLWVTRHVVWISRASSGWFRALRTCFPGFRARVFRGGVTKLPSFGTCDNGFFAAPGRRLYVLEGVRDGAYSTLQASSAAVLSPTPENGRAHERRRPCRAAAVLAVLAAAVGVVVLGVGVLVVVV